MEGARGCCSTCEIERRRRSYLSHRVEVRQDHSDSKRLHNNGLSPAIIS